ncbi:serine/threonine-protein kinase [Streptacidiphilus sp. PAMC 29251]
MNTGGPNTRLIDGRFELLQPLGGGGMGLVWRARDNALHREVALKEVRPPDPAMAAADPAGTRELRERVLREARSLARLQHPNVVIIHHIVDSPEHPHPWLVMELVSGGSLADRLDRGPLSVPEAARIGRGVLAALNAAHRAGIQHRDVKPGNVLLRPDGTPVLTDFGIAAMSGSTALTSAGSLIGSPEYIAPERIRGVEGDPSSDLWSLGMMLYVAVEGHHPLRRASTLATLAAVLDEPLPPPTRSGPLGPLLSALLARDPALRPDGERLDQWLAAVEQGGVSPQAYPQATEYPQAPVDPRTYDAPWGYTPAPTPNPYSSYPAPADAVPPAGPRGYGPAPADRRPPPTSARRRRAAVGSASAAAVVLASVLAWNLWPTSPTAHAGTPAATGTHGTGPTTPVIPVSAAPTTAAPTTTTPQTDLLTPAGLRKTVAALRPLLRNSRIIELDVYPGYANAEAPTLANPAFYDDLSYRDGLTSHSPGGTVDSDTTTSDLRVFNWDSIPALLKKAQQTLKVPHPTSRYIIIGPDIFDGTPSIRIYLSDAYGSGYLEANNKGTVTHTYPRGS